MRRDSRLVDALDDVVAHDRKRHQKTSAPIVAHVWPAQRAENWHHRRHHALEANGARAVVRKVRNGENVSQAVFVVAVDATQSHCQFAARRRVPNPERRCLAQIDHHLGQKALQAIERAQHMAENRHRALN